jgi:replicative DNA helicase
VSAYTEDYVRIPFDLDDGLKIMQQKMAGGLTGGCLYILGGIPSSGKTGLINNIADNICLQDYPVLFFSYDDGVKELRYRTYSRFSGFDIEDFNKNSLDKTDVEAIAENEKIVAISSLKYIVPQMINIEDWPGLIEQVKNRHGQAPVIIIDYLRKLRTKDQQADERLRVDEILSYLTDMAKTYNIPILAVSELARDSYKSGQRLSMASFKESGSIEYEASWLGILAAVEENGTGYTIKQDWEKIVQQDGNVDLILFKAKRGTGEMGKVSLKMDKNKMTFRDRIDSSHIDSVNAVKKASRFD